MSLGEAAQKAPKMQKHDHCRTQSRSLCMSECIVGGWMVCVCVWVVLWVSFGAREGRRLLLGGGARQAPAKQQTNQATDPGTPRTATPSSTIPSVCLCVWAGRGGVGGCGRGPTQKRFKAVFPSFASSLACAKPARRLKTRHTHAEGGHKPPTHTHTRTATLCPRGVG